MQGQFFWYDVATHDTKGAADFYASILPWGTQASGSPDMDYTLFTLEGQGVAGLMAMPPEMAGAPPRWMTYISADDVDAAVEKIVSLGGKLHRGPIEAPGIIRFAVVSDPQGAGFLVAKGLSSEPMRQFPMGTPGTVGWLELYAGEWEAAFKFYEAMFGWTKADAFDMGPMGTYQLFATGGEPVGGIMTKPDAIPHPNWGVYFNVDSVDAAVEKVKAGGGQVLMGPHEVPGGQWILQCLDPQGAYFALVSTAR